MARAKTLGHLRVEVWDVLYADGCVDDDPVFNERVQERIQTAFDDGEEGRAVGLEILEAIDEYTR